MDALSKIHTKCRPVYCSTFDRQSALLIKFFPVKGSFGFVNIYDIISIFRGTERIICPLEGNLREHQMILHLRRLVVAIPISIRTIHHKIAASPSIKFESRHVLKPFTFQDLPLYKTFQYDFPSCKIIWIYDTLMVIPNRSLAPSISVCCCQ